MSIDVSSSLAFALALAGTAVATPAAIAIARRTAFYDHPVGFKRHLKPTPYLGGVAVVVGLFAGCVVLGAGIADCWAILVTAAALLTVGTIDDRVGLGIGPRLIVEVGAGALLFYGGVAWSPFGNEAADLLLTVIFVVAVVNAYNLMDNLDGAAPTVALVSAAGIAIYATAKGDAAVGALAAAMAGACAGFLPYNLRRPRARIFLGDGGSMAIGGTLAALLMSLPGVDGFGWQLIPVMVVMVGLPAFDVALVTVSRLRRRVNVLSGARDHLTHRLLKRLGSSGRVALCLTCAQATLFALAIALLSVSPGAGAAGAAALILTAMGLIAALVAARWERWLPAAQAGVTAQDESPA